MFTYLVYNLVFIGVVLLLLAVCTRLKLSKPVVLTLVVLLVLTAVFDSLIIYSGIVAYDSNKLLGIYIGLAPVEDFFYSVLAGLAIPALWVGLKKRSHVREG